MHWKKDANPVEVIMLHMKTDRILIATLTAIFFSSNGIFPFLHQHIDATSWVHQNLTQNWKPVGVPPTC